MVASMWIPVPATGNYWILALDDAYETALVGTPDRHYLWILARTAPLPPDREWALIQQAERLGEGSHGEKLARVVQVRETIRSRLEAWLSTLPGAATSSTKRADLP